jgi:signal transduction histidine kinase
MALRHGGRVELTGNEIKLYLPADAESGQQELQQLRKELEQAQQLGAVYAKELAEAFTSATGDSVLPVPVTGSQLAAETRLQVFVACASSVARSLRQTTESLKGDINRLSRVIGEQHELVQALVTRQIAYGELVTDLDRVGRITLDESAKPVDIAELLRDTVDAASGRAQRQDISLTVYAEGTFTLTTRASVMGVLLRSLVEQAVQSSPRRTDISVTLCRENTVDTKRYVVRIVDGGPLVPDAAISGLLQGTADPSAIGRPSALNWLTIGTTAQVLGLSIETGMSTNQRSEIRLCTS